MAEGSWIRIGAIDAHLDARTINAIVKEVLDRRATSVTQSPELRADVGEELLKIVTQFVPKKSGTLRDSGRATTDGRLYWTAINKYGDNYASYVYDRECSRWPAGSTYANPSTPGTHPRWMKKVQPGTAEWDAFINNITPIIIRGFAQNE